MSAPTIDLVCDAHGVARLTLARPEKHNALNLAMIRELTAATRALGGDPRVRVVVLAGQGRSFCGGGDLNWMRAQIESDRRGRMAEASELAHMFSALDSLPKPLIGRVHGPAYGGGVGLMAVCDTVIAADTATFALAEVRLGLIPATIGPYLVRSIGERWARRFMMSAKTFDAATALAIGLASVVVPAVELDAAVASEIAALLECAPGAVASAKALCQHLARTPGDHHLAWTADQLANRWETEEAMEGLSCFVERREPSWRRKS